MGELRAAGDGQADLEMRIVFTAAGRSVVLLPGAAAPALQHLLERCGDYYVLAEGRPVGPNGAIREMSEGPAERVPQDLLHLGIMGEDGRLDGVIGVLRHHRRPDQWYLGLMLLDPAQRGGGLGRAVYQRFERWIAGQGADSVVLAVLEANARAARFWESLGFAQPRCYPARTIGLRRHVLIEYEKDIGVR